jgi:hypothetical protein
LAIFRALDAVDTRNALSDVFGSTLALYPREFRPASSESIGVSTMAKMKPAFEEAV